MSKPTPLKMSVVQKYLKRFPNVATRTLGKKIYDENPEMFTNAEGATWNVRRLRGATGPKNRGNCCDKSDYTTMPNGVSKHAMPLGMKSLPDWEPLQIGKCRALILSDIHAPFHDDVALKAVVADGVKRKADTIILNGDFMDFHAASFFRKDPRRIDFALEIETGVKLLRWIRSKFPKARIIFKEGNHDERWEHYLIEKAPLLLDVVGVSLPGLLKFGELNIEHVRDKRPIRLGKLNVIHGHEYRFIFSPVNVARGLFLRAQTHCLCGHMHKNSYHSEPNLEGKSVSTWSTGCLCDLKPEYDPLAKWQHGAAFVEVFDDDEEFIVHPIRVLHGKIY